MPGPGLTLAGGLDRWWRAPAPALRLALVRAVVGIYCLILLLARTPSITRLGHFDPARFDPVGVVTVLDAPLPPALTLALLALAFLGALAFTLGWRHRVTAPLFALALLWVASYRNSWGHMSHADHLVIIHVLVLSVVPAADALSLDARAGRVTPGDEARYGWPLRLLMLSVVISYMLAGWAKLDHGGWAWVSGEGVRNHVANDTLRKLRLGGWPSPFSPWLLRQPWMFALFGFGTLVLELGGLVAMPESRLRYVWIVGVWLMHMGIVIAMGISFPFPVSGVAFAAFLPLERGFARVARRVSLRTPDCSR